MAEVGVKCAQCGMDLKAPNVDELAKNFKDHAGHAHSMEMTEEEAKKKVKMMLES